MAALVLGVALGCGDSAQNTCPPGSDACPCADGDMCLTGLQCIGGFCQAGGPGDTGTAATTDEPTGSGTGSAEVSTTVEPTGGLEPTTTTGLAPTTTGDDTTTSDDTGAPDGPSIPTLRWHEIGEPGELRDVAFTPDGQVAVVGYVSRKPYNADAFLAVRTVDGEPVWEATQDGPAGFDDDFRGVAVHADGKVTAVGQQIVSSYDHLTVTYDSQGTLLDPHPHGDNPPDEEVLHDVSVDAEGNLYVCGYMTFEGKFEPRAMLGRYGDVSGDTWMTMPGQPEANFYTCRTGPSGYVVAAGPANGGGSLRRFDATGDVVYMDSFSLENWTTLLPFASVIDPFDEFIYLGGQVHHLDNVASPWLGGWDKFGARQWLNQPTKEGDNMRIDAMTLDDDGWLRVVGTLTIFDAYLMFILTHDHEGVERDRVVWAPPDAGPVRALGVAARGDTLFVVGGTTPTKPSTFMANFAI